MKSKLLAVLLVASALFAAPAIARTPVPIINHDNIVVATSSGKTTSSEQVKQAVLAATVAKNWSVAYQADGKLLATLSVQSGKHVIVVEIAYSSDKYSLNYKDSKNMKYGVRDEPTVSGNTLVLANQPVIHPFYNNWVQELKEAIRTELLKL